MTSFSCFLASAAASRGFSRKSILVPCPQVVGSCAATGNAYTVLQSDVDAGQVVNTATAAGTAASGTLANATDTNTVTITAAPSWTLDKATASTASAAGDVLTYTFSVTNTGNVTITSGSVSDPLLPTLNCTFANVATGATASWMTREISGMCASMARVSRR